MKTIFLCLLVLAGFARSVSASADDACPILLASAKQAYADFVNERRGGARVDLARNSKMVAEVRAFARALTPVDLDLLETVEQRRDLREFAARSIATKFGSTLKGCESRVAKNGDFFVYAVCPGPESDQEVMLFFWLDGRITLHVGNAYFKGVTTKAGIQAFLSDLRLANIDLPSFEEYATTMHVPAECMTPPKTPSPVAVADATDKKGDTGPEAGPENPAQRVASAGTRDENPSYSTCSAAAR